MRRGRDRAGAPHPRDPAQPAFWLWGLERARSAVEARDVIADLVERHGQGGRGGLEQASFRDSSSFLIADATSAFVLETAGRRWASERVTSGVRALSNALSLPCRLGHADPVRTRVACAADRAARSRALAAPSLASLTALLRDHGGHRWPRYHPLTGPLDLGPLPADRHDRFSLFWQAEELHRLTMRDPERVAPRWRGERDAIEAAWAAAMPSPGEAWAVHRAQLVRWKQAARAVQDGRPWWARSCWRQRERWAGREAPDGR